MSRDRLGCMAIMQTSDRFGQRCNGAVWGHVGVKCACYVHYSSSRNGIRKVRFIGAPRSIARFPSAPSRQQGPSACGEAATTSLLPKSATESSQ